ncbi:hypothetical protein AXG93_4776s1380 [Marchantia polymorpha subsp. ruderalis]|uniref:Uncharacterized protein n=1 Tax=Marchantia polymorpha subsp. ruderalis TaxID=1480154 RepID=A0A176VTL2_MARPO|nr:hypothetical protein AXG93_4776s1380 [Marchantia polymorpha subsp. ruderalis]
MSRVGAHWAPLNDCDWVLLLSIPHPTPPVRSPASPPSNLPLAPQERRQQLSLATTTTTITPAPRCVGTDGWGRADQVRAKEGPLPVQYCVWLGLSLSPPEPLSPEPHSSPFSFKSRSTEVQRRQ